jgi:hypothetical protein
MADVTGRERGQMLLIASLIVATSFVGLTLVVNSAIYTENLSTRETSSDTTESLEHVQLVERDLQELIDKSNAAVTGDDYNAVKNGYKSDLVLWSNSQERRYGATGRHVNYKQEYITEGTRIQQTNASRNFTAGNKSAGKAEWTLVNDTTRAGEFEMTVDRTDLLDAPAALTLDALFGETFYIEIVDEAGQKWEVYIFQDDSVASDTASVVVRPPGGFDFSLSDPLSSLDPDDSCTTTGENVSLDLVEGTFDGEECSDLSFYTDNVTGTPHNISYRNTKTGGGIFPDLTDPISDITIPPDDRVTGTYNLTVDTRADRTPYYDPDSGDDPNAKAVIYESAVTTEFRTSQTQHSNEYVSAKWSRVA